MDSTRNVTGATSTCRGTRWPEALTSKFSLRTDIENEGVPAPQGGPQCLQRYELSNLGCWKRVGGRYRFRESHRPGQTRLAPILPRPIEYQCALVPVGLRQPEPEIGAIAVKDDSGIRRKAG